MTPKPAPRDYVTIVSGLPRSGTSMTMRMVEAGGIEAVTDNVRRADEDNPKGYYEFEAVKKTREDASWVAGTVGKLVKMVYTLLYDLPDQYAYRVLFMQRKLQEVIASQNRMLARLGHGDASGQDAAMMGLFQRDLKKIEGWLPTKENFRVLYVDYNQMLANPLPQIDRINEFLDGNLDTSAMAAVVDPSLYRNRC